MLLWLIMNVIQAVIHLGICENQLENDDCHLHYLITFATPQNILLANPLFPAHSI